MLPGLIRSERSVEDILAGRLRLTFGGRVFVLPVLSIAANRRWREAMDARLQPIVDAAKTENMRRIMAVLGTADTDLLDIVVAYDETHVLPPRDELEELARPYEALQAVAEVRAAANPLLGVGLAMAAAAAPKEASPDSTSSPSTNGRASRTRGPSKVA